MLLKMKNFDFEKNYIGYENNFPYKIVHLKKIFKFTSEHFLIGYAVFVWIVKNVIKNEKPNLCEIRKKSEERKLSLSKITIN